MRKHTKRKVWRIRPPGLPMLSEDQQRLAFLLHTSAARLNDYDGCNVFSRTMAVVTIAMELANSHDAHSRNLLRTATLMLEKCAKTMVVDEATQAYCQQLAVWLDQWVQDGRINWGTYAQAEKIISVVD